MSTRRTHGRGIPLRLAVLATVTLFGLVPAPGDVVIGPNVRIGRGYGPNAAKELESSIPGQPDCCYDVPPCSDPACDDCLWALTSGEHQGWAACDDDPKAQVEPSIAAAWWDTNTVIALFIDFSRDGFGITQGSGGQNGFAVSTDGGLTWRRLLRYDEFYPDPCNDPPAPLAFIEGFGRNREDICPSGEVWGGPRATRAPPRAGTNPKVLGTCSSRAALRTSRA